MGSTVPFLWAHVVCQYVDRINGLRGTECKGVAPLAVRLDSDWISHECAILIKGVGITVRSLDVFPKGSVTVLET